MDKIAPSVGLEPEFKLRRLGTKLDFLNKVEQAPQSSAEFY